MFNRPLILSLSVFLFLMIFTSVIKNNTRNIEKNIEKLNTEVSILNNELLNAEMDFIYLSSPDKLEKKISLFDRKKYTTYDFSRIFLSTEELINFSSKQTKKLNHNE